MADFHYDDRPAAATRPSKLPLINLAARAATLASLIASLIIVKANMHTYSNNFLTYEYMFYVSGIGIVYCSFQTPLALYYLKTKKHVIKSHIFIRVDFYGDKVMAFLLGTAAGAAFGATRDLKEYTLHPDSKSDQFFAMNYIAAVFMFVGYMFSVSAVGVGYSFFQMPLAVYYLKTRKHLIKSHMLTLLDFIGDKILIVILGTGVGAAFGATRDLKRYERALDPEADDFFSMAFIAAVFVSFAFLASLDSSVLSSLALAKME